MSKKIQLTLVALIVAIGLLFVVLPAADDKQQSAAVVKETSNESTEAKSSVAKTDAASGIEAIRERLKVMIPVGANEANITATKIAGLYQVQLGMTVVYMSADGNFLMNGNMINLNDNTNLTQQVQFELRKAIMAEMNQDNMIVYPAAAGVDKAKHTITVFSDIDCPYCAKLHKEIPLLNAAGINVRYMAYPRSGPNTPSFYKAVSVWCSDEPAKLMDDAMMGVIPEEKTCQHPVDEHMLFANRLEVNGTPNILLESGDLLPGYVPARKLIGMLNQ